MPDNGAKIEGETPCLAGGRLHANLMRWRRPISSR